jgi:hypothetical protein
MFNKKITVILLSILLVFTQLSGSIFAETSDKSTPAFSDVDTSHWAYSAISWMVDQKVLAGYPDGTFKPGNIINRGEFAKIMVLTLELPLREPENSTFKDIAKSDWEYKYVETAKYYLTGFRTSGGDYFRPKNEAVREDMAVALVKALKFSNETPDESILDIFNDSDTISPALRKYVAIAVNHNIMKGNPVENSTLKAFRPQNPLTRAEAAVLLYNLANDQKITYEDVNEVEESEIPDLPKQDNAYNHTIPQVTGKVDGNRIVLNWKPISDDGFTYYKVVASKCNPYPRYPQDGYLYVITDRNNTTAVIDNSHGYNGGDFGSKLVPGQKYYFSVTAVYGDIKVPGNVVALTYPASASAPTKSNSHIKPAVTATVGSGKITLKWQPTTASDFSYYKVVVSKSNANPKYPEDGYLMYITDKNTTQAVIDNSIKYNGGDIDGYLVRGQKYYFSVTNVYSNEKIAGNSLYLTFPSR